MCFFLAWRSFVRRSRQRKPSKRPRMPPERRYVTCSQSAPSSCSVFLQPEASARVCVDSFACIVLALPCLVLSWHNPRLRQPSQRRTSSWRWARRSTIRSTTPLPATSLRSRRKRTTSHRRPRPASCYALRRYPPPPPDQMIHWQQCSRQNYQLSERDMHLSACVWRGHAAGQDRAGGGARGLPGGVP
jgi:hypothetical protein